MKIENGTIRSGTPLESLLKKTAKQADAEIAPSANNIDEAFSVELSATAEKLDKLPGSDEINRDKVAAIRAQLASGTYNISGKDVANKILSVLKA